MTLTWLLLAALLFGACGSGDSGSGALGGDGPASTPTTQATTDEAVIYAAVIQRLVTKDHTFGGTKSPFQYIYVVDGPVAGAGDPEAEQAEPSQPFSDKIKNEIKAELAELPPIHFISDANSVRLDDDSVAGVKNEGAVITLGPVEPEENHVEVGTGLWCGGLCGQWLTYELRLKGTTWHVTGTTGPVAIS